MGRIGRHARGCLIDGLVTFQTSVGSGSLGMEAFGYVSTDTCNPGLMTGLFRPRSLLLLVLRVGFDVMHSRVVEADMRCQTRQTSIEGDPQGQVHGGLRPRSSGQLPMLGIVSFFARYFRKHFVCPSASCFR